MEELRFDGSQQTQFSNDLFAEGNQTASTEDLFAGSNQVASTDDLFGDNNQTVSNDDIFTDVQASQGSNNVDDMLAGSDDDDLFSQAVQPQQEEEETAPSALIEWEAQKQIEIQRIDAENQEKDENLSSQGSEAITKYNKNLHDAQEKRARHNIELDQQFFSDMEYMPENKWEKVVSYIDFNRADLHQKDVSKMKSILLQLKH